MPNILIFGDSIVYGAFDPEAGGWADRLKAFFFKDGRNYDYFVYNLGISGDTTENLLERFEFETKQRSDEDKTSFIFSIGINDSAWMHSKNNHWVLPNKFIDNIKKLIQLAQKFSSKIIFVSLSPVDETKTTPIPWNTDLSYKNEWIQEYNKIIKSICEENKILFIDVFEKFIKLDYTKLLEDGLHPNSKGH
ncbi:MAG: GDSL-type esterase/lipase family protein [bacterium]|nr:GDSL-type esterase/lipase family protein [bacterium]